MKRTFSAIIVSTILLASSAHSANTLSANQSLQPGQVLTSLNGAYFITLQSSDGNLVVYRTSDSVPIWSAYTSGGKIAVMQGDRNFVVYKAGGTTSGYAIWSSNTARPVSDTQTRLVVRNDGSLYLFGASNQVVWSTPNDPANQYGSESSEIFALCFRPGTNYQSPSTYAARNYADAKRYAGLFVNDGAKLGECDRTYN
jgi:hypothetical protein